ncbi:hypothetical protein AVEN_101839-1 [Araneus ventricosus]|uniref:Uncharacterized protein n=1 Tax=Araneus ventricosus TaxID=182803 RepID=A0A4Y2RLW8_ARAVE|nr:hypothetical protein AVEN_2053-1 [Araneus ventricosus]GBN75895.1 hypothetical protein AVEN_101839-1 [Araneus ventricosus]
MKTYEELPVAPFSPISGENMLDNIDRMVLSNDQQYLYEICLAISCGECYSDLALRKPDPVAQSRWITIAARSTGMQLSVPEIMDPESTRSVEPQSSLVLLSFSTYHACIPHISEVLHCECDVFLPTRKESSTFHFSRKPTTPGGH